MKIDSFKIKNNSQRYTKLVSVVMAVHKGVQYKHLKEAAESILKQNYLNYEFIIVLDGKLTSDQEDLISLLKEKYKSIFIIKLEQNVGPGAARNAGIKQAKGEYIVIMDSDDIASADRLTTQINFLEENSDIAVVGSFCEIIDDSGIVTGFRKLPLSYKALRLYSLFFCPLNNPTVTGRAKIFKEFMYDEKYRQGEDYRLWIRLLSSNYYIANIATPLVKFRVSSDLYERRSGYHKGLSDLTNRLYAIRISPICLMPLVVMFAFLSFGVRFLPAKAIGDITSMIELIRSKIIS